MPLIFHAAFAVTPLIRYRCLMPVSLMLPCASSRHDAAMAGYMLRRRLICAAMPLCHVFRSLSLFRHMLFLFTPHFAAYAAFFFFPPPMSPPPCRLCCLPLMFRHFRHDYFDAAPFVFAAAMPYFLRHYADAFAFRRRYLRCYAALMLRFIFAAMLRCGDAFASSILICC